jgi:tetratricopeptide (TPR) repeat protein
LDARAATTLLRWQIIGDRFEDSYQTYKDINAKGIVPTPEQYHWVLTACAESHYCAEVGKRICEDLRKRGDFSAIAPEIALLIVSRETTKAQREYKALKRELTRSEQNSLMAACTRTADHTIATMIYHDVKNLNLSKETTAFNNVLINMLFICNKTKEGKEQYERMVTKGPKPDAGVYAVLLLESIRIIDLEFGQKLSYDLRTSGIRQDTGLLAIILKLHISSGNWEKAIRLHEEIIRSDPKPDSRYYRIVLKYCAETNNKAFSEKVLEDLNASDIEQDTVLKTATMNMLMKVGKLEDALKIYNDMLTIGPAPNFITYYTLLKDCAQRADYETGAKIVTDIKDRGMFHDIRMKNFITAWLTKCGKYEIAMEIENDMMKNGPAPNSVTYVGMLLACGDVSAAKKFIALVLKRNITSEIVTNSIKSMCDNLSIPQSEVTQEQE